MISGHTGLEGRNGAVRGVKAHTYYISREGMGREMDPTYLNFVPGVHPKEDKDKYLLERTKKEMADNLRGQKKMLYHRENKMFGKNPLDEDEDPKELRKTDRQAEAILKALVHATRPGMLERPRRNMKMQSRTIQKAHIYGLDAPGGYNGEPNMTTTMRTVEGVNSFIDKAAPVISGSRDPFMTETLKKIYSRNLADAMKTDTTLYKPVSDNYYQRLAAMYKMRLRQTSLFNAGN